MTGDEVLAAIRSRRVVRAMTDEPVERAHLEAILDAARWAPTAGNRHLQRYVATDDPATLRVLRMVSPGMIQRPTAAIVICTDRALAAEYGFPPAAPGLFVDVGTAAATILLAAHALGIGRGAGDLVQPGRGRRGAGPARRVGAGARRVPRPPRARRARADGRAPPPHVARPDPVGAVGLKASEEPVAAVTMPVPRSAGRPASC